MSLPSSYSTLELNSRERVQEFLNNTDNFLLDCDGVLWRGTQLLPQVAETLEMLKKMGKKIFYVTNNSSKSRKQYAEKFRKMGIPAEEGEILSSSFGAAEYLKNIGFNKKVYVIGCEGIYQEMEHAGIQCVKDEKGNYFPHNETKFTEEFFASPQFKLDPEIGAVVVGYDNHFNNFKLTYAMMCLKKIPGCKFIATNTDPSLPYASGIELPGAGSFVFSLRACSEIEPLVIGKPETNLLDIVVTEQNLKRERTVMVGDRLETDVLMGNRGHVQSCAVLTGIAQRHHVEQLNSQQNGSSESSTTTEQVASPSSSSIVNYTQEMKPRYLLPAFGDLYNLLN